MTAPGEVLAVRCQSETRQPAPTYPCGFQFRHPARRVEDRVVRMARGNAVVAHQRERRARLCEDPLESSERVDVHLVPVRWRVTADAGCAPVCRVCASSRSSPDEARRPRPSKGEQASRAERDEIGDVVPVSGRAVSRWSLRSTRSVRSGEVDVADRGAAPRRDPSLHINSAVVGWPGMGTGRRGLQQPAPHGAGCMQVVSRSPALGMQTRSYPLTASRSNSSSHSV